MAERGRPTKFDPKFVQLAERACTLGYTDVELAKLFEVDIRTIDRWKLEHEDFCRALKVGKDVADDRVERSLYMRAVGYDEEAVKIFMPAGASEPVYAPYTEKIAPDTTAQIFWLKNRRRQAWADRQQHEMTGPDGGPIKTEDVTDPKVLAQKMAFLLASHLQQDELEGE